MFRTTCPHVCCLPTLLLFTVLGGCSDNGDSFDVVSTNSAEREVPADVVITTPDDLDRHIGETVVIRGELTRLKLPSVLGVDLSFNDIESEDMFGKQVECRGVLTQEVVTNAPLEAARGDGIYYALVAISEDEPVTVRVVE